MREILVAGHSEQTHDRVNILLPVAVFESDSVFGLKRGGPDGQWGKEDYASARVAAEELENLDMAAEESDTQLVQEVLRALANHDQIRGAMAAADAHVHRRAAEGRRRTRRSSAHPSLAEKTFDAEVALHRPRPRAGGTCVCGHRSPGRG